VSVPEVEVRLFAGLRELIGSSSIRVDMPSGATVADLRARIGEQHPDVRPFLSAVVCAVDEEYVPSAHVLRDGERVALIPPVSGG
jgi:molybdopterin converting factor subunit 1